MDHIENPAVRVRQTLEKLLHAVMQGDLETYRSLVDPDLTCFEPESSGCLVRGVALHQFFLQQEAPAEKYHFELVDPAIRVHGDMAVAAYTLMMVQPKDADFQTTTENVTRIFRRSGGQWRMIHFHRSAPLPAA